MRNRARRFSVLLLALSLTACGGATTPNANQSPVGANSNAQTKAETTVQTETKQPTNAQAFTSAYTDMKNDCKTLPDPETEEGGDPAGACKGYGDYRIFISYSAASANFSVEHLKDKNFSVPLGAESSDYGAQGEKVEWRMKDGTPFAVIMRIGKYKERTNDENPFAPTNRTGSTLVIKGLKGWEQIDFKVDGATPNANEKAREMADQNYSKK